MFNLYQRPGAGKCPVASSGRVGVPPPCSYPSACRTGASGGGFGWGGSGGGGGGYSDGSGGGGGGYGSTGGSTSESTCPGQAYRPCARGKLRSGRPDFFVQVPADKEDRNVPSRDLTVYKLSKAAGKEDKCDQQKTTATNGSVSSGQWTSCEAPSPDSYVLRIKRKCGAGCEEQEQLELELKAPPPPPKTVVETQVAPTDLNGNAKKPKGGAKKGKGGKGKKGGKKKK